MKEPYIEDLASHNGRSLSEKRKRHTLFSPMLVCMLLQDHLNPGAYGN
jgi:hypothetical protein